jgi:hypothetical protein
LITVSLCTVKVASEIKLWAILDASYQMLTTASKSEAIYKVNIKARRKEL